MLAHGMLQHERDELQLALNDHENIDMAKAPNLSKIFCVPKINF